MLDDADVTLASEAKPDPTAAAAERYVFAVVLPLWMAAGNLDYLLHRRSRIEATSGTFEAQLHALGITLCAVPVLAGLLLEIDAGVLSLMGAGYVAHVGMTVWDIAYASERRQIVPLEQHVHALLEVLPFTALSLVALAHCDQVLALVGGGSVPARWKPRRKRTPIPRRALAAATGAFAVAVALPYAEELLRCMRHERERAIFDPHSPREHRQIERSEEQRVPKQTEREAHAR